MTDSKKFYDEFIDYQIKSGINDRIYSLFQRVKNSGLNNDDHILEIGCGIGCLSYLLSKKIKRGLLESVDISPISIEYAKNHIQAKGVHFASGDIMEFNPIHAPFDKVLMFDVLEHIPHEFHQELFCKIYSWMQEGSCLLINIPNPQYIEYDQKHHPEALQETDIPVYLNQLIPDLIKASLTITKIETYSIWVKDDYIFLRINKLSEFNENVLQKEFGILRRLTNKLKRILRKIQYRYP